MSDDDRCGTCSKYDADEGLCTHPVTSYALMHLPASFIRVEMDEDDGYGCQMHEPILPKFSP